MNLTITFAESDVVLAIEVATDMTVADLKAYVQEEAGFNPDTDAVLFHNGSHLDESDTLEKAGLQDNDMVQLTTATGADSGSQAQPTPNLGSNSQDSTHNGSKSNSPSDSTLATQIEAARQQILYDPQLFAQLSQQSPELAEALHGRDQFQKAYRTLHQQQLKVKAENEEIDRNFRLALEEMPEAFTTVTMLFANIEVNGLPVKAFIDSGAQTTIMSPECAERCHLSHLIDKRHRGMAYGVGQATILGRIHMAPIKIGSSFFACSMTVIEGTNMEFLLGLDMLKHHQATLDLKHNRLIMGDEELPFLSESEIPKNLIGTPGSGAAIVSKPGTGLPRGALNNLGGVVGNQRNNESSSEGSSSSMGRRNSAGSQNSEQSASSQTQASAQSSQSQSSHQSQQQQSQQQQRSNPPMDQTVISNLMSLGFSEVEVKKALSQASGNADIAAALLFGE